MLAEYYNNILYPLQDKAILAFKDSPFYLTGGTALSRVYYSHRDSDDLDYFVNDHSDFQKIAERQIERLSDIFTDVKVAMRDTSFYRIFVSEERLKIELVNDVPSRWQMPFIKDGRVDVDAYIEFGTQFNELINHEPKSFKPIIDRVMKL
ncbi:MAG: nucleotidyl transferase AbiEii/AbiGii toxin family protein [Nitrospinae bacterium]|nr:nucleotidyl transferase AbiEii/AbiGii toxin family protein [Nitrospinota bacterium]